MILSDRRLSDWTIKGRLIVQVARGEAFSLGHPAVGPEHFLLGCAEARRGDAAKLLKSYGATADRMKWSEVFDEIPRSDDGCKVPVKEHLLLDDLADDLVNLANAQALRLKRRAGTRILLLALTMQPSSNAIAVLKEFGVDRKEVRLRLLADFGIFPRRRRKSTVLMVA